MNNRDQVQQNLVAHFNRDLSVDQHQFQPQQYELLSAYLDGEVTPEQRRQVERWMADDPQFKALYFQWLQVRAQWRSMPIPQAAIAPKQLANRVFEQIHRRIRTRLIWGGAAITAVLLTAISGSILGENPGSFKQQLSQSSEIEPLRIALHEPVVPIINPDAVSISVDQPLIQIPKAPHSRTLSTQP